MKLKSLIALLLITCFVSGSQAQSSDTSVFFRYAATFDYLLPVNGEPYTLTIPDSLAESVFNTPLKNAKLDKTVKLQTVTEKSETTIDLHREKIEWDGEGRVVTHAFYTADDKLSGRYTRINYLNGKKISSVIAGNEHENFAPDTLSYVYNRSGWISNWRKHEITVTSDVTTTGNRLYDSRGNLIVATYMYYGPLLGAYTYEYNSRNQLVRRCFTTASGAILCTDTIEYAEMLNAVQFMIHKLKIAGSDKWTLIETKTINGHTGKMIGYSDYNDADTSYFYRNLPSYSLVYEYDDKGRMVLESFGNEITPRIITARYEYGKYDQPDVIEYSEQVEQKKTVITRVYSRDERRYDEQGRIKERDIITYRYEEMSKKSGFIPKEIIKISYQWQ